MNEKDSFESSSDSESQKNYKQIEKKSDFKLPCDMKSFWKSINEKFFTFKEFCDPYEINHRILSQSKYGKINFSKTKFN